MALLDSASDRRSEGVATSAPDAASTVRRAKRKTFLRGVMDGFGGPALLTLRIREPVRRRKVSVSPYASLEKSMNVMRLSLFEAVVRVLVERGVTVGSEDIKGLTKDGKLVTKKKTILKAGGKKVDVVGKKPR